ncbi:esterase-like activity of phytase family protein [Angustibacter aerolatus]
MLVAGLATVLGGLGAAGASAHTPAHAPGHGGPGGHGERASSFQRLATYPVYLNRPDGEPAETETVAEISAVTTDGRTLLSTDGVGKRIHLVDISDPRRPRGLGVLPLTREGDAEDEPTSVAVVGGYALVVVNTSPSYTAPSGRLDVVRISDRTTVRSVPLAGQPDSIAVAPSGRYAAIAIENERDEDATPPGGEEGDLPQAPAGLVQVLDLAGTRPASWGLRSVPLTDADGSALPALAGLTEPTDPEPEYITINRRDQLAVTLQENDGVVLVDLPTGRVTTAFSAGSVALTGVDTEDDDVIDQTGSLPPLPREPDGIAWVDDRYVATANEGDWRGGTRGWSVFDTRTGTVVWDAGNTFEQLAIRYGLHDDSRSDNKGAEPENVVVSTLGGRRLAFVGAERGNFVAVYDLADPRHPRFRQLLPTTNGPEGLLAIPSRGLLVTSSEVDDAAARVRAGIGVYALRRGTQDLPSIRSADVHGAPIGWGALGALSAVPGARHRLVSVTDAAYATTKVLTIDTSRRPAVITRELPVTRDGQPIGLDAEGVAARRGGGYWLGVEGAKGPGNQLVRLDARGAVQQVVPLPADVAAGLGAQGVEGVAVTDDRAGEHVLVALQRELSTDPKGVTRIGRYDVRTGAWTWFGYPIGTTTTSGDWIGVSEVTVVGGRRLAVIERDKLNGPDARVKRVFTVDLPSTDPAPGTLPVLRKRLALDVLPSLRATGGWTQEKLEGLTIGGDGRVYAVTDDDGLDDATGETDFLRLGSARSLFRRS